MPSATGAFGATNVVALFQGFVTGAAGNALVTRAAQNCVVTKLGTGQYQLALNNVSTDDCNFMAQVHQFVYAAGQTAYAVVCTFPPVADESLVGAAQTYNYINFGFYSTAGTPFDPNYYGLFNIAVFSCNDGLVGLTNPATGLPFRTPGNP
jgi:hypothetical protein